MSVNVICLLSCSDSDLKGQRVDGFHSLFALITTCSMWACSQMFMHSYQGHWPMALWEKWSSDAENNKLIINKSWADSSADLLNGPLGSVWCYIPCPTVTIFTLRRRPSPGSCGLEPHLIISKLFSWSFHWTVWCYQHCQNSWFAC